VLRLWITTFYFQHKKLINISQTSYRAPGAGEDVITDIIIKIEFMLAMYLLYIYFYFAYSFLLF